MNTYLYAKLLYVQICNQNTWIFKSKMQPYLQRTIILIATTGTAVAKMWVTTIAIKVNNSNNNSNNNNNNDGMSGSIVEQAC